jgi:hypothetical protein
MANEIQFTPDGFNNTATVKYGLLQDRSLSAVRDCLVIQYTRNYYPYLNAVPSSRTLTACHVVVKREQFYMKA